MGYWRFLSATAAVMMLPVPVCAQPAAGTVFRDCSECPEMVVVPAGTFMMGSPEGEGLWDEYPQHSVTLRGFSLGRYEVTFAQWDACVAAGGCSHSPDDEGWGRDDRPVINVTWSDARQYAAWLSRITGQQYRLPSEAEWEYAARAGTTTAYWWGVEASRSYANYGNDRWNGYWAEGADQWLHTAPVGSFPANGFGFYDILGNVWEWTQDCRNDDYTGAPSDGSAWESGECSRRVMRGGSYVETPRGLRAADRFMYSADDRFKVTGFRVARTL